MKFFQEYRHPCNIANVQKHSHANGEGEESSQPALAFILLIVAIPEHVEVVSITHLRTTKVYLHTKLLPKSVQSQQ